ncbi:radical SAM protein [Chloroflexota bacterium]
MLNKIACQRKRPTSLIISLTNLCTTQCAFCYRRDLHLKPRYFPFETFKSLLDELGPTLQNLEFSGIGEPTMHSQFREFVLYARQKYPTLKLQLGTNGSLIADNLSSFLVEQGFEQVWISLNAATAKTHSLMMPGLDFNKIVQSIVRLREERAKACLEKPSIKLTFVVTKANYTEAEDYLDLGVTLGADKIWVRSLDYLQNRHIYESQRVSREEFEPILERIEARAKSDNRIQYAPRWAFWPHDFPQPNQIGAKSIYCPNAQHQFGVYFSSGEVTPCCYMAAYIESPGNCIGNIYEESALQIWNGQRAKSLRKSLKKLETAPDICKQCPNYWGKQWKTGKRLTPLTLWKDLELLATLYLPTPIKSLLKNTILRNYKDR